MASEQKTETRNVGGREITTSSNSFAIPVFDCEEVTIAINGVIVTTIVAPYTGNLKCYFGAERKPLQFK